MISVDHFRQVDKDSPVPLYYQLRNTLESMIRSGEYPAGSVFPSEKELGEMFAVSRVTVRQTMAELLQSGMLYRTRARGRLYVAPVRLCQKLNRLQGFFKEDMLTAGLEPRTEVLGIAKAESRRIETMLHVADGESIYRIERVHYGDGEPLALQTSYIPASVCNKLEQEDLSQSLFDLIEKLYKHRIVRATQAVRVREATRTEMKLLKGLTSRLYIFEVERTSYADNGVPVEFFNCILPVDRYELTMQVELSREFN